MLLTPEFNLCDEINGLPLIKILIVFSFAQHKLHFKISISTLVHILTNDQFNFDNSITF
jgi:hypothetical protein